LAIHPSREIVASGAKAAYSRNKLVDVFVWDVATQQVLARLSGFHRGGVGCLKFSPDGSKLLTIGQDEQHSVAVYDWANQILLSTTKIGADTVYDAAWENESRFMTAGAKLAQFFTLAGKNIRGEKGVMGKKRGRL
jgi:microtubule-associated protein-like 6